MPKNLRFWTNVGLIAFAHILVIVGLIRWSRESKNASAQSVVWLNGGGGDGLVTEKKNLPAPMRSPLPRKESKTDPLKERQPDEARPYLASAPSDIQLPTPRPSPKPAPTATPPRSPKPSPTAKAKTTPKPTPKPTSTASPTRTPKKIVMAKASPKPSPTAKPTPEKKESEQGDSGAEKKEIAKALAAKDDSTAKESKESPATQTGSGKGTGLGNGSGRAGGAESQFGWYGSMLHDRFYSEWVQPTTLATTGSKNSVLVKLRIEKDGRVSSFEIIRPSGSSDLDESVKALANRVSRVEPLPDGLGKGDHYDVKINFELNSE